MLRRVVNFIFPFLCPGCRKVMHTAGFCSTCWKKLDFIMPPYCQLCGEPLYASFLTLCQRCRTWLPLFVSHRSLWRYGPLSRRVIFALKHGRQRYMAPLFATWILPFVLPLPIHYIMPVPLHRYRLSKRGFNQSALIAKALCQLTGWPLLLHDLKRWSGSLSQGGLSLYKRQEQVEGVFECTYAFSGENILLIDDVYTTGATLSACASALREAGVGQVHAITMAKVVL